MNIFEIANIFLAKNNSITSESAVPVTLNSSESPREKLSSVENSTYFCHPLFYLFNQYNYEQSYGHQSDLKFLLS